MYRRLEMRWRCIPVSVPPSRLAGAVQDTVAVVSPGTAVTPLGYCGLGSTGTSLSV
jgi:hypothetical protein